jgi:hypothetical protein
MVLRFSLERNGDDDSGSDVGARLKGGLATKNDRALLHANQSQRVWAVDVLLQHANAIIISLKRKVPVLQCQLDRCPGGVGMARYVGQDFLKNAEHAVGLILG